MPIFTKILQVKIHTMLEKTTGHSISGINISHIAYIHD